MNMLNYRVMGNNLKYFIKCSGKTQVEVATLKGIAPESLSRHISGRSQFSIKDAIEYAEILGCSPEQLLFEQKPIEIIGTIHGDNHVTMNDNSQAKKFVQMNMTPQDNWALLQRRYTGTWNYADGSFILIDTKGIQEQRVLAACNGSEAIVKTTDDEMCHTLVFPQPDGRYTLSGVYSGGIKQNINLTWGCPVMSGIIRPDLLGWQELED